ncbi:MAG: hypothetical protein WDA53_07125 [Bacillota bacterium]
MSTIKCPENQGRISKQAEQCSHCGSSPELRDDFLIREQQLFKKRVVKAIIIIALVMSFVVYLYITIDVLK